MNNLSAIDYAVFIFYFILISGYGYWIYRSKKNTAVKGTNDFFLAEGSLTWWAIGASLIISTGRKRLGEGAGAHLPLFYK